MSTRRMDDALAGQDLPAAVLVFDLLDAAEVRDILAQHDFDHAGLSLKNGDPSKARRTRQPAMTSRRALVGRCCRGTAPVISADGAVDAARTTCAFSSAMRSIFVADTD